MRPPLAINVCEQVWGVEDRLPFDAIVAINMIHIAPWRAGLGLFRGARRLLRERGILFLYGPFMRDTRHSSPANAEFDASLRARNPEWGVRDLSGVETAAVRHGLRLDNIVEMPANNLSVVLARERARRSGYGQSHVENPAQLTLPEESH